MEPIFVGLVGTLLLLVLIFFFRIPVGFAMAVIGFGGFVYVLNWDCMIDWQENKHFLLSKSVVIGFYSGKSQQNSYQSFFKGRKQAPEPHLFARLLEFGT